MLRIIVVAYRSLGTLPGLLDSLERNVRVPAEVVLWDNDGSLRGSSLRVEGRPFAVRLEGNGENLGFGKAVNCAAALPSPKPIEALLLLNPDGELASVLDESVYQRLLKLDALTGLEVFDDPAKTVRQASARSFPGPLAALAGREGPLTRLWPGNPLSRHYLRTDLREGGHVDWVSGSALFCPMKRWLELGGYDERYFLYVEDVDLGRTAAQKGVPVIYSPLVSFVHAIRGSSSKRNPVAEYHHHRGMWLYWWKWSPTAAKVLAPIIALGIALRYLARLARF